MLETYRLISTQRGAWFRGASSARRRNACHLHLAVCAATKMPRCVQALYGVEAADAGQLTFAAGDIIEIVHEGEPNGWWEGRMGEQSGWFPSSFCGQPFGMATDAGAISADGKSSQQPSTLPDGWLEMDDGAGNTYYYHTPSGDSVWERPVAEDAAAALEGATAVAEEATAVAKGAAAVQEDADPAPEPEPVPAPAPAPAPPLDTEASSDAGDALPPGWHAFADSDGDIYYYHEPTAVTSWVRPPPPTAAATTGVADAPAPTPAPEPAAEDGGFGGGSAAEPRALGLIAVPEEKSDRGESFSLLGSALPLRSSLDTDTDTPSSRASSAPSSRSSTISTISYRGDRTPRTAARRYWPLLCASLGYQHLPRWPQRHIGPARCPRGDRL